MGTTNVNLDTPGDSFTSSRQNKKLVLFEDESILVINKPAGLPTLPDGYDPSAPHLKSVLEPLFGRLWIIHRLDRQTSGVVLLSRSAAAHRLLNSQFEKRQVVKRYLALVLGHPDWDRKTASLPLRTNAGHRHRTVIDPRNGKPALTELQVIEKFNAYSLIEAVPHTGRTHQVRAHLAAFGLPLLGDPLYGGPPGLYASQIRPNYHPGQKGECPIISRPALHACSLDFLHPLTSEPIHIEASYPPDFKAALKLLKKYNA